MGEIVPKTLGRYEVIRALASGGMAEVLLARSSGLEGFERHVVVKRIRSELVDDPQFVKMFLGEARLAASLHHANIVQVHDVGVEAGEYFFAMEYVHGQDLRTVLREVAVRDELVPFEEVVVIGSHAAAGLHHAHEQRSRDGKPLGLVHRDVSPANILVGYDGTVKIVDFGIAKAAVLDLESTKTGLLKGKVAYMSPEQCVGGEIDRRSDIFSLGIVLYELATATRLFKYDNEFLTMTGIVESKIPPPSTRRQDLPPPLERIILKALAKAPSERFQTAEEVREALEEFSDVAGLRTSVDHCGAS